jgi:hypothetical protein
VGLIGWPAPSLLAQGSAGCMVDSVPGMNLFINHQQCNIEFPDDAKTGEHNA